MALTDIARPTDVSMLTDLYELTMAQGLWENGKLEEQGCFTAFYRDRPFGNAFAVMCGTAELPELVENLRFTDEDIDYLSSLSAPGGGKMFNPDFLEFMRGFRMRVDIDAVPEGELVFPREPMVRVTGSALECQLLETALLNTINFQTLVATKTARVVQAAKGRPVAEFGLRRAQGPDGGLAVARASYVAGCASTSNVLAGRRYGIPVFGTHAHSWVMSFDTELEAFRAFARSMPKNCTLLIDTYDVREGVENAIIVAKEMEARGDRLAAIRIDSGDLAKLSSYVRSRFSRRWPGACWMRRGLPIAASCSRTIWTSTPSSPSSIRVPPLIPSASAPSSPRAMTSPRSVAFTSSLPAARPPLTPGRPWSSSLSSPINEPFPESSRLGAIWMRPALRCAT